MKRAISTTAIVLCCICPPLLHAQKQPSQQLSRTAIEIGGVKLRLGMTKAQVAEKLAGQQLMKPDDDELWLGTVDDIKAGRDLPTMQFTRGLLTFAERRWTTPNDDTAEALYGLITHLNDEGFAKCTVRTDTHTNTDVDVVWQRVWIDCGEKTALLARETVSGGKSFSSVSEQLGRFRFPNE